MASHGQTDAVCYRQPANFNAWACNNLGNRTVRVNGVTVMCNPYGTCRCRHRWTSFYWWTQ